MEIMLKGKNKTRAQLVKEQMELDRQKNTGMINLYPETEEPNYYMKKSMLEAATTQSYKRLSTFQENTMKELVFQSIYGNMIMPVLEAGFANEHQKELAAKSVIDFVNESDVYERLNNWKYRNIYLAEFAQQIEKTYKLITETAKDKLKEGLTEKDAYTIENEKIDDFLIDTKDIIPPDITKTIMNRVEDSINDFIADNKVNKLKVMEIYNKAQNKIAMADGDKEIQESALRQAKRQEKAITESPTNVFGAMTRIMVESVMKIKPLNEAYTNESGKVNFEKVLGDVRVIYTFMEAMNTLGVIDATPEYIHKTLQGMRESMDKISQDEKMEFSGDSKQPKEVTHGDGTPDNNDKSSGFNCIEED